MAGIVITWAGGGFKVRTQYGTIIIENVPTNAQVEVEGERVTITREGEIVSVTAVKGESHRLKVLQGGKEIWTSDVIVKVGGEPVRVRVDKSQSSKVGAVTIVRPGQLDCMGPDGVSTFELKKSQVAWAKFLRREVEEEHEISPGVKMSFLLVPPGKFRMGSPEWEDLRVENELQHEVTLTKPFYLGKFEVTQNQFVVIEGKNPSDFKGANLPVENISWEDAVAFCRKLRGKDAYRLPTEAEWEYACRGGRPSSHRFGIGDGNTLMPGLANIQYSVNRTSLVGSYQPNAIGLHDMHGNVWEWCEDWFGDYPSNAVILTRQKRCSW